MVSKSLIAKLNIPLGMTREKMDKFPKVQAMGRDAMARQRKAEAMNKPGAIVKSAARSLSRDILSPVVKGITRNYHTKKQTEAEYSPSTKK
jgi:hypothetical protein